MTKQEFSKLYSNNYNTLLSHCRRLTGSNQKAQDLLQDSAIKALLNCDKLEDTDKMVPWFKKLALNIFITEFNKQKRRRELLALNGRQSPVITTGKSKNLGESKLSMDYLISCLDGVSKKYKDAFLMHFTGYAYNEIANKFAIPIGTVKSRINTCKTKLKLCIPDSHRRVLAA